MVGLLIGQSNTRCMQYKANDTPDFRCQQNA